LSLHGEADLASATELWQAPVPPYLGNADALAFAQ
jgi:hypothetical protein